MPPPTDRRLYWVPIIHTPEDLGSVRESVRRHYIQKIGKGGWDEHLRTVEDLWSAIRARLEGLKLDVSHVHLYQDGLPVCGQEENIVRDLAAQGSRNHRLLLDLMGQGATLIGTESPELLLREYTLARQILGGGLDRPVAQNTQALRQAQSQDILSQRDRFIADRIDQTLPPGATGLIFLGMLHSLEGLLPGDIELVQLDVVTGNTPAGES